MFKRFEPSGTTSSSPSGSGDGREDASSGRGIVVVPAGSSQTVWWVIAVLLAVVATALVARWDDGSFTGSALAGPLPEGLGLPQANDRGIYAFTGQMTSKSYGLFMVDVDAGTFWCYEMQKGRTGELQLQLVAARTWIWDRHLEEYNCAEPTPGAVQAIVEQQQSHREKAVGASGDTVIPEVPAGTEAPAGSGTSSDGE